MAAEVRRDLQTHPFGDQPGAQDQDESDAHDRQWQPDQCELEVRQITPGVLRRLGDDHIDRTAGQQQQTTGTSGEGQRHQQPRGGDVVAQREENDDRKQCGHGSVETDERRQHRGQDHRAHQDATRLAAGELAQPLSHPRGDPGGVQALADDEQSGDENHRWVGQPCQRLRQVEDAGEVEGQRRPESHQFHGEPVPEEQSHHCDQSQ